jgi:hypothetical protein
MFRRLYVVDRVLHRAQRPRSGDDPELLIYLELKNTSLGQMGFLDFEPAW